MRQLEFRKATLEDAPEIARLVNDAFRPGPGAGGWTSESLLISGERTSPDRVRYLIEPQHSAVLLVQNGARIVACVHVEHVGSVAQLGMLAVEPGRQNAGTGKALLAYAEAYAANDLRASVIAFVVLEARETLIAFYLRRGYLKTGRFIPYSGVGSGTPLHDGLRLVEMVKPI